MSKQLYDLPPVCTKERLQFTNHKAKKRMNQIIH